MTRLVINVPGVAPGGGLTVLLGLLGGWRDIDAPLDVVILASRAAACDAIEDAGFGEQLRRVPGGGGFKGELWRYRRLPALARELDADVVLSNNVWTPGVHCPQVVHHQTLWSLFEPGLWPYLRRGPRRLLQALWCRQALRNAAANAYISTYMKQCAERIVPASAPRNYTLHNGLDASYISAAKQPCRHRPFSGRLCALQAPTMHKDNESLVVSVAELVRRMPQVDWFLKIAGGGDWTPWRRRASELGVEKRIEFIGFLNGAQVADLFAESDCLVYPSVFEGFGLPIIEAMAMGCPTVAIDATAVPEIAGDAALLTPPRRPDAIAEAVIRLASDDELRRRLVERGKERAQQFSWTNSATRLLEIIQSVL